MLKRFVLAGVLVAVVGAPVNAQTSLPCIRFPYQASVTIPVSSQPGNDYATASGTIALPASPIELEQITVRLHEHPDFAVYIATAGVTTVLTGRSIRHGIELNPVLGGPPNIWADPKFGADITRLVKLYADPSSNLTFDFKMYVGASTATIDATVVGRLVSVGCWIGPQ